MNENIFIKNLLTNTFSINGGTSGDIPIFNNNSIDILNTGAIGNVLTSMGPNTMPSFLPVGAPAIPDPLNLNRVNLNILGPNASTQISLLGNLVLGSGNTNTVYAQNSSFAAGSNNSLFGFSSGSSLTSGTFNSLFGGFAGSSSLTSSKLCGFGYESLKAFTSNEATAFGYQAMNTATTSSNSSAFGYQSLFNSNINDSTAIGRESLGNSTGSGTCLGYKSGYNNVGNNLIAIGSQSGIGNSGANIFIGDLLTSNGVNNIFISSSANSSDCVLLGYSSGVLTLNSTIAIGNNVLSSNISGHNIGIGLNSSKNHLGQRSISIGENSLQASGTPNDCTIIGDSACFSNISSEISSFGALSLFSQTSGIKNCAFGFQSLYNLVSNSSNSSFGYQALKSTTSSRSSAFGDSAGLNIDCDDNTLIGYQAGLNSLAQSTIIGSKALSTTFAGTCVGYQALQNITGSLCTALGNSAGRVSSGSSVFIGEFAGSTDISANEVIIGANALLSGTTGNGKNTVIGSNSASTGGLIENSICLGYNVLNSCIKAFDCVFIGNQSGISANSINSTIIGYNCGRNINDDNVVIGYQSANTATPGTFNKNVFIGSNSASNLPSSLLNSIAIGYEALSSTNSLNGDIAIGYQALAASSISSSPNIAIGYQALLNGGDTNNIAVGYQALFNGTNLTTNSIIFGHSSGQNSVLNNNIVVGSSSGNPTSLSNTIIFGQGSGSGGTFSNGISLGNSSSNVVGNISNFISIGNNSLAKTNCISLGNSIGLGGSIDSIAIGNNCSTVGGISSIIIGYQAGTAGLLDTCIGIGNQSIQALSNTGLRNVCLGYRTYYQATTGSDNIFIGHSAGGNILTSCNRNTVIGNLASAIAGTSNGIALGYNASVGSSNDIQLGENNVIITGDLYNRSQKVSSGSWIGGGTTTSSIDNSGNIIRTPSDKRLKEDFKEINKEICEKFKKLNPVSYNFKKEFQKKMGKEEEFGLLAQEVEELFPQLVYQTGWDDYKGVKYIQFTPIIIKILQKIMRKLQM